MDERIETIMTGTWAVNVDSSLERIADALERIAKALDPVESEKDVSR